MTGKPATSCSDTDAHGLCRPIGRLKQRDPAVKGDWIPLLFINGTSVATGRRIVVSDVRVDCLNEKDGKKNWFMNLAYDFTELRSARIRKANEQAACNHQSSHPGKAIDMKLSAASMMSARFPIISTHGVIRDADSDAIADSVVDGGYFENDGLATAADIVRELQGAGLHPVVIQVVNEPEPNVVEPSMPPGPQALPAKDDKRRPIPPPSERTLFDVYTSIGRALYATRSGHEDGHRAYLQETLRGPLIRIGVDDVTPISQDEKRLCRTTFAGQATKPAKQVSMDTVSMSWWMSQPVQAYLDAQLCRPQVNDALLCAIGLDVADANIAGAQCLKD